jgi:hypothetical protein
VTALGIRHEHLPVEIEKHIEGGVARLSHLAWLSHQGNLHQATAGSMMGP